MLLNFHAAALTSAKHLGEREHISLFPFSFFSFFRVLVFIFYRFVLVTF